MLSGLDTALGFDIAQGPRAVLDIAPGCYTVLDTGSRLVAAGSMGRVPSMV